MFRKMLVAVDGSEPASHALEYAAELAEEQGAELVIVTVIPPITNYVVADSELDYYPRLEEDVEKYYVQMVEATEEAVKEAHPDLKVSALWKHGHPATRIVEAAGEQGVDLIVVGNRGRGGLISWMLGSTSRSVVESCTVPVLVVKDREYCEAK